MTAQFLSREQYPELYAAIAKAYGPLPGKDFHLPPMTDQPTTNRQKSITEDDAIDYLNLCKNAYTKAINESQGPLLISQYRYEIRYWEDYLHVNWPEERAKRELFGGRSEPMTKEQLTAAMDQVYERMAKIPELAEPMMALDAMSPQSRVTAEIWGVLKTLAAIQDEVIVKLPPESTQ
jgi:hypothetical protein